METTQDYNSNTVDNRFFTSLSALQIRLDCTPLYEFIDMSLIGSEPRVNFDDNGKKIVEYVKTGKPLLNNEGLRNIKIFVYSVVNNQTVQGNFTKEKCSLYCSEIHRDLIDLLTLNCYDWGIVDPDDLSGEGNIQLICNFIMNLIYPFISRTIDDGERKSYAETIRTTEQSNLREKDGGFGVFKK